MRAWFGPHSQMASISGSATMSVIVAYALASPTSSVRASAAADAAFFLLGLQTPRTSASRMAWKPWMWNRVLKPLPMKPMPRGLVGMRTRVGGRTSRERVPILSTNG
jgi:hypothetical protein